MQYDHNNNKYILCVGSCVLDVIHTCQEYPEEDSDRRATDGRCQRGGNASNICSVLRQLNDNCEFLGSLSSTSATRFLIEDCAQRGINIEHCVYYDNCVTPFSSVILNMRTGSRTIVHSNPNLPILTAMDFRKIPLERYKWIHFEARNESETKQMIDFIVCWNETHPDDRITISVELENHAKKNVSLVENADFVFLSKDYSQFMGWSTKENALQAIRTYVSQSAKIICPWGEDGAVAVDIKNGATYSAKAYPPEKVVDSLGAGDTFIAATIHCLSCGFPLDESIDFGCRIAGAKIGQVGYDAIHTLVNDTETVNLCE